MNTLIISSPNVTIQRSKITVLRSSITSITQAVYLTLSKTPKISQSYRTHKALGRVSKNRYNQYTKMPAISSYFRQLNTQTTKYNKINNNTTSRCKQTKIMNNDKIMINNNDKIMINNTRAPKISKRQQQINDKINDCFNRFCTRYGNDTKRASDRMFSIFAHNKYDKRWLQVNTEIYDTAYYKYIAFVAENQIAKPEEIVVKKPALLYIDCLTLQINCENYSRQFLDDLYDEIMINNDEINVQSVSHCEEIALHCEKTIVIEHNSVTPDEVTVQVTDEVTVQVTDEVTVQVTDEVTVIQAEQIVELVSSDYQTVAHYEEIVYISDVQYAEYYEEKPFEETIIQPTYIVKKPTQIVAKSEEIVIKSVEIVDNSVADNYVGEPYCEIKNDKGDYIKIYYTTFTFDDNIDME